MAFQFGAMIGEVTQIVTVRQAFLEQYMHDGCGERTVCAGTDHQMKISLGGGFGSVRVHHDKLGAALPGCCDLSHQMHLGVHRIAAPDDNQVRLRHFTRVNAVFDAHACSPSRIWQISANGANVAG